MTKNRQKHFLREAKLASNQLIAFANEVSKQTSTSSHEELVAARTQIDIETSKACKELAAQYPELSPVDITISICSAVNSHFMQLLLSTNKGILTMIDDHLGHFSEVASKNPLIS